MNKLVRRIFLLLFKKDIKENKREKRKKRKKRKDERHRKRIRRRNGSHLSLFSPLSVGQHFFFSDFLTFISLLLPLKFIALMFAPFSNSNFTISTRSNAVALKSMNEKVGARERMGKRERMKKKKKGSKLKENRKSETKGEESKVNWTGEKSWVNISVFSLFLDSHNVKESNLYNQVFHSFHLKILLLWQFDIETKKK